MSESRTTVSTLHKFFYLSKRKSRVLTCNKQSQNVACRYPYVKPNLQTGMKNYQPLVHKCDIPLL